MRRAWLLLLLAAGGIWLWYGAGGLFPSTRRLTYTLENSPPVLRAEFQLWQGEALLFRTTWQNPSSHSWTQEVPLKPGRYRVQLWTWAEEGQAPRVYERLLEVGDPRELQLRFQ